MTWVAVAVGGALGSMARHGVNLLVAQRYERAVPYATAIVNLAGAAVIGVLAGAIAGGRLTMSPALRAFVFVGILGGFTTFSSFMLDTLTLLQGGESATAWGNLLVQNALGFALVWAGYQAAVALR